MRFETNLPKVHKIEPTSVDRINIVIPENDEEQQIENLRKRINEWKLKTMLPELSNRKNNAALYEKSKLAKQLSFDLGTRIIGNQGDNRFTEEAVFLLGPLGNPDKWTHYFTTKVQNAITTDLYEYPMTFNTDLINTFKHRNLPMFE
jgi:hypothetical protein